MDKEGRSAFHFPITFAACLGIFIFVEITAGAFMKSALTTIERRFQLSSASSALISTSSQIGNLSVLVFVSFFGSRYHRPKAISIGSLLLIVGYLLIILPHFLSESYEFTDISSSSISNDSNVANSTDKQDYTCSLQENQTSRESQCDEHGNVNQSSSNIYILIVLGAAVCGIGGAPVSPLGMSYIDDHVAKENSALYIGLMKTIAMVGPMTGFILGSFILKIWVEFLSTDSSDITITPRHPAWVGAWWLGIVIAIVLIILASIPFWLFPRTMDTKAKRQMEEDQRIKKKTKLASRKAQGKAPEKKKSGLSELFTAFKRLMRNSLFVLSAAEYSLNGFKISGVITFYVKYLEVGFGKSAAEGSFLMGTITYPFIIVGVIFGSLALKIWKLDKVGPVRIVIAVRVIGLIVYVALFFVGCETIDIVGVTTPYQHMKKSSSDSSLSLQHDCNRLCGCWDHSFLPVCGTDGLTYVTPCHAGCTRRTINEFGAVEAHGQGERWKGKREWQTETRAQLGGARITHLQNYTSCACIPAGNSSADYVNLGRCSSSNCEHLAYIIIALSCVANFAGGFGSTSSFMLLVRVVDPSDKAFAIGIMLLWMRIFGWIPAPIIFGAFIDMSCLMWTKKECSNRQYCSVYDVGLYRAYFFTLIIVTTVGMLVTLLAYLTVLGRKLKQEKKQEELSHNQDVTDRLVGNGTSKESNRMSIVSVQGHETVV